jgi:endonuclease/exonuclease/phosphatase family metal-dependent hydrolase
MQPDAAPGGGASASVSKLKVASWNLLRRVGAGVADVAELVRREQPDLLLLQEATEDIGGLPALVGGHFFRHPMHGRIYGLAAWSPHEFPQTTALGLPVSVLPGGVPPRVAQIVRFGGVNFANVHLSHGQFLNRWQLLHIAGALEGPAAIIGDFNAVGPIKIPHFSDIGPRQRTHRASNILALRLDRCMGRGLQCVSGRVLEKGPSDHHPILLELAVQTRADPLGALFAL